MAKPVSSRATGTAGRLAIRAALAAAGLVVGLVLAELALALVAPQRTWERLQAQSPPIFRPDDRLPYRLIPGATGRVTRDGEFDTSVEINRLGYRGGEFTREKGDRLRVLAIGDSFTFGWGVEHDEAWPAVLERVLRSRRPERNAEVINAGFAAGYAPDTYYVYLQVEGLALEPDAVVVALFVGNDFDHHAAQENTWEALDPRGLPTRVRHPPSRFEGGHLVARPSRPSRYRSRWLRNSHLAQAFYTVMEDASPGPPRSFNPWMYRSRYLPRTEREMQKAKALLAGISQTLGDAGVPVLFALIPAREQLRPDEYRLDRYPFMHGYDLDKPQRLLARFFDESELRYLDLLSPLRKASATSELYFPRDAHLTASGQAVVAAAIGEALLAALADPAAH